MRLVVHAVNVHQGGGRTLLLSLISSINQSQISSILLLDERLELTEHASPNIKKVLVKPSLLGRLKAEITLKKLTKSEDVVLCFGNLPPLFNIAGRVFVYIQNRYLCDNQPINGFRWQARIRILLERVWLKKFLRNYFVLVQSETMKECVRKGLGRNSTVMPFIARPLTSNIINNNKIKFDYLYVASDEPHKNHLNLINAWIKLANQNQYPSLCLTLDKDKHQNLWTYINKLIGDHRLNIYFEFIPNAQIASLYTASNAVIYPSFFESFGLPLQEAKDYGLDVIASERDYVRDILDPVETFDPESPTSIARAVLRHLGVVEPKLTACDTDSFLKKLISFN